ncbi:hypothetical protein [Pedobacter sp.]
MEKFPFTGQGAKALMTELYQLSDPALQLEANAAGADFRLWIGSHFELDQSQLEYLDGIDETWIAVAAQDTKAFLAARKPIRLQKIPTPASRNHSDDRGKLLDLDKKKTASYSEHEGYQQSEELLYTISHSGQQ